jgi:hypothetical protein
MIISSVDLLSSSLSILDKFITSDAPLSWYEYSPNLLIALFSSDIISSPILFDFDTFSYNFLKFSDSGLFISNLILDLLYPYP